MKNKMKKILIPIALVGVMTLTIAACNLQNKGPMTKEEGERQTYAFSAVSAGGIISAMNNQVAGGKSVAAFSQVTEDETIDMLNGYMSVVEGLLVDGGYSMKEEASDRVEYAIMAQVSYTDMTGEKMGYKMYYNEVDVNERVDKEDFEIEIETKAKLEGVIVIDGVDYPIEGNTKSEVEDDENEVETTFKVVLGENDYLLINSEVSLERNESEQSYSYMLYKDGKMAVKSIFEMEQESDETEIEFRHTENGVTQVFYFEKEREWGKEFITIHAGQKGEVGKYKVFVIENQDGTFSYEYQSKDGNVKKHRP